MSAIQPLKCSCVICQKETSQLGIQTHYRRSHGDATAWNNSIEVKHRERASAIDNYNSNPSLCAECSTPIKYDKQHNKFCSHSCAALASNRERLESGWTMSNETKQSISSKLSKPKFSDHVAGEYSKVFFRTCKKCDVAFFSATSKQYCFQCKCAVQRATDIFSFRFNVFHYPDLFDLTLIEKYGWYSQGGKRKYKNTNGISRDHRVSVSEALKNEYDYYYITHPINCKLMHQSANSSKGSKSSITYAELIKLVDEYDGAKSGI